MRDELIPGTLNVGHTPPTIAQAIIYITVIMMGSCAFLMPVGAFRFVRSERIDLRLVIGLALGGIPAVLVAAFVVKSLPVETLRWGVVVVALYAASLLIVAAVKPRKNVEAIGRSD